MKFWNGVVEERIYCLK